VIGSRSTLYLMFTCLLGALPLLATPAVAESNAPLGFQILCLQTPQECRAGGSASITLDVPTLVTLRAVNARVNRKIIPRSDGAADVWSVEPTAGDCEDYALTKRHELIALGIPPSALRLAYVKVSSGEGHAILVVETSAGALVLDNLNGTVRPLKQSGYRMLSMSGANPRQWS
jgi:predicted transglutaminase-like cysteine proteinase